MAVQEKSSPDQMNKLEPASNRPEEAPSDEHRLYAPIARFGFAVAAIATVRDRGPRRFLLSANAAEPAVRAVSAHRYEFESAVRQKVERSGWSVDKFGVGDGLSDFAVDTRLGAVFDFTEFVIRNEVQDTEFVMRFCVTVCNKKDTKTRSALMESGDDQLESGDDESLFVWRDDKRHEMPQHSKIWVRFACLKFRSRTFAKMSPREMRNFFDEAENLAGKINQAILSPYKKVIREIVLNQPLIGTAAIRISTVFKIKSFTVSTKDRNFPIAYRKILLGGALSDVPNDYDVRKNLRELKHVFDSTASEILPVDDLSFMRGIYWVDLKEKCASLIGIANNSLDQGGLARSLSDVQSLRAAPSNVIGILSGTMLAAAI